MIERINWKCVAVCCGVIILAIYSVMANARDVSGHYADSPYAEWFKSQHNEKGEWCCDKSDGHYYDGAYKFNDDGSVTIVAGKDTTTLPSYMVLKHPNPTGRAVWWFTTNYHGERTSYCFAPGTLG